MPLPTPRSVICSPSHIMNSAPVTSVDDGDDVEGDAGRERQPLRRQRAGEGRALDQRDEQGAVAGVLGDLCARPASPSLAQLVERRIHRRQEVHDDAGGDVGHDAEREDAHPLQRAAGEHVEEIQNAALLGIEEVAQLLGIDARHWDVRAHPIHEQGKQHEQQPAPGAPKARPALLPAMVLPARASVDAPSRCLNGRLGATADAQALHLHGARDFAGKKDAGSGEALRHHASVLQRLEGDVLALDPRQFAQAHFGGAGADAGIESRTSAAAAATANWPPSKPGRTLPPERDFCPLWPRPAVLP